MSSSERVEQVEEELSRTSLTATKRAREAISESDDIAGIISLLEVDFSEDTVITKSSIEEAVQMLKRQEEGDRGLDSEIQPKEIGHEFKTYETEDDPFEEVTDIDRPDVAPREPADLEVTIEKDITGQSTSSGEGVDEFIDYYQDRYDRIESILQKRTGGLSRDYTENDIGRIKENEKYTGEQITVIGRVLESGRTRNDTPLIEVEDGTGRITAFFTDDELRELVDNTLEDEVIAIDGVLEPDDGEVIFGDAVHRPDIPPTFNISTTDEPGKVALISDIHFASTEFNADKWNRFVDWVRTTPDVKYILVAGDLVEGINVYPNQKEELSLTDITDQYKLCAEAFAELPDEVHIISSTGNHDDVRLDEPQPALSERYTKLFNDNVTFVGNPVRLSISDVTFLLYHGMSLQTFDEQIPDASIKEPTLPMKEMLKKRHLGPSHDQSPRNAPEDRDYLVIDEPPDYFHTGHVHIFGFGKYRGCRAINSGTWQDQTDFQKSKNIMPDVGYCPVVDLQSGETTIYHF